MECRKCGPTSYDACPHWYQIPISDDGGDRIIAITLTDRGIGDDGTVNSVIVDDGGPSLPMTKKGTRVAMAAAPLPDALRIPQAGWVGMGREQTRHQTARSRLRMPHHAWMSGQSTTTTRAVEVLPGLMKRRSSSPTILIPFCSFLPPRPQ